jgi:hypothetical protein
VIAEPSFDVIRAMLIKAFRQAQKLVKKLAVGEYEETKRAEQEGRDPQFTRSCSRIGGERYEVFVDRGKCGSHELESCGVPY